jgi:hypothetical protein
MIGIRQADGSFYEILGDAQAGHKRLVLSAARRDQRGVKIDLYRSLDGTLDEAASLGTISLDDPDGLGFQDIEFRVDLGADDQLQASAALPGQAPRTLSVDLSSFRAARSDLDILGDEGLAEADLDTLDDSFSDPHEVLLEPEPMTLDLPDSDFELADPDLDLAPSDLDLAESDQEEPLETEAPRRSDADILGDESLNSADLDTLDDFSFDEGLSEADSLSEEPTEALDDGFGLPDLTEEPEESDGPAPAMDAFDLGDLDAGFGTDEAEDLPPVEAPAAGANPAEEWEKVSFDDMEAMEFLDTGDEISAPSAKAAPPAKAAGAKAPADDDFSMDHDDPLDLGDYDADLSDLSELPDLDGNGPTAPAGSTQEDDDFDQDFLPPPALTDTPSWGDEEETPAAKPAKAPKAAKAPKPSRSTEPAPRGGEPGTLDKTALVLSLATLSLLLLLIVVLLFLNMIKAPQAPVVQPEVMRWKPTADAPAPRFRPGTAAEADLGAADPVVFEASSVLEVPAGLRGAKVALTLPAGDSPADAARRFGDPVRRQGNQLFW